MHFPASRPDQRSGGHKFGSPEWKQAQLDARVCAYERCDVSLRGRNRNARFCSVRCNTYQTRLERRRQAVQERPRCCICLAPMPYKASWQGPGVTYSATTCSPRCRNRRQTIRADMMRP